MGCTVGEAYVSVESGCALNRIELHGHPSGSKLLSYKGNVCMLTRITGSVHPIHVSPSSSNYSFLVQ